MDVDAFKAKKELAHLMTKDIKSAMEQMPQLKTVGWGKWYQSIEGVASILKWIPSLIDVKHEYRC